MVLQFAAPFKLVVVIDWAGPFNVVEVSARPGPFNVDHDMDFFFLHPILMRNIGGPTITNYESTLGGGWKDLQVLETVLLRCARLSS